MENNLSNLNENLGLGLPQPESINKIAENTQTLNETPNKQEINKQEVHSSIEVPVIEDVTQSYKNELKKISKGLRGKKKQMVETLSKEYGIVTRACAKVGISRMTHKRWIDSDEKYRNACQESIEVLKDLGEASLVALLLEKNPTAVVHFAKTKNRDRGYGEVVEEHVHHEGPRRIEVVYVPAPSELGETHEPN